ncbi:MAG: site-specific integrase [Methanobrevibacter sp.]|nr:site-specific integrase [Methanobrevibacter sp.]
MTMKSDSELITYFGNTRNLKKSTLDSYRIYIKEYATYNDMTMVELLDEAEREEEEGKRWKYRSLRKRLLGFRAYLYEKHAYTTAKSRFSKLLAFYRHFEIEIHPLPPISNKNIDDVVISFKDLPDKEIIKKALKISAPLMRSIILFMSSSGCARMETLNLTVGDFITATEVYHKSDDIYEALKRMKDNQTIVPLFYLRRQKTNKYYYTCCSPEATVEIINYLLSENRYLQPDSPLFKISGQEFIKKFRAINNQLGLGKVGYSSRFRSHMMRKFHASQLRESGLDMDTIDALQGKSKTQVRKSYFFDNPENIRSEYIKHMDCLTINLDVNSIDIKSPEYIELENEHRDYRQHVENIEDDLKYIKSRLMAEEGK